ncbi:MAG: hypothetical protein AAFY98_07400 [Verrucomicrobiota bacterium]
MSEVAADRSADEKLVEIPAAFIKQVDETISHYPVSKRSASLPLLHLWQEEFGCNSSFSAIQ